MKTGLIKYDAACHAIQVAVSVDEVLEIKNKAEAMRVYGKQAGNMDMANQAAEIRIRAERKLGVMIKEQKEAGLMNTGTAGKGRPALGGNTGEPPKAAQPKLSDMGISKSMSSRAQAIASVPDDVFEQTIAEHREQQTELTSNTIRKLTGNAKREEKIEIINQGNAALPDERFNLIYADPPWRYEHSKTDSRKIENQYPTMALDEIKELSVPAAEDCVLFMWATSPKLAESIEVLEAWGFTYRTCAVWDKGKIGMGYYFRQQHELLLVATKGNMPVPEPANRPSSVMAYPRGEHSSKPVEVYDMLNAMYPEYPKIELFCRTPQEGWAVWGNQSNAA